MRRGVLVGLVISAVAHVSVDAATLLVPADYGTIQLAIDAAAFGDTVLVAPGTYDQSEVRLYDVGNGPQSIESVAFLKPGLTLRSEDGAASTTLRLGVPSVTASTVLGAFLGMESNALEGFTIESKGDAAGVSLYQTPSYEVRECVFSGITTGFAAAGMNTVSTGLIVVGCVFVDCSSPGGGGILAQTGDFFMEDCRFENCSSSAVRVRGAPGNQDHDVTVLNTEFVSNHANSQNGALAVSQVSDVLIQGCWFADNVVMNGSAGAVGVGPTPFAEIRGNVFLRNHAGGIGRGGAIYVGDVPGVIAGNTLFGNGQDEPSFGGAAIQLTGSNVSLDNNIVAASVGGSAVRTSFGAVVTTSCNVFWENEGGNAEGFVLDPSDREVDPEFCDPEADDVQLMEGSPCLPEFSDGCGLIGALGQGCGAIAVEETSWGSIKVRYREED